MSSSGPRADSASFCKTGVAGSYLLRARCSHECQEKGRAVFKSEQRRSPATLRLLGSVSKETNGDNFGEFKFSCHAQHRPHA